MFRSPTIKVSVGEIVDKYTILLIKEKHADPDTWQHDAIAMELYYLQKKVRQLKVSAGMIANLERVNKAIWDLEDQIRIHESNKDFGEDFVATARAIYAMNDRRFKLKEQINNLSGSKFKEQKILPEY